ncbi:MAG: methyltransferase domain-containing protein [Bdellovibrionaceae bacterium]|nr:methyltransferase domain-containing protein [Bdellovibrio sp.]
MEAAQWTKTINCKVCGSENLDQIIDMPGLPLTGIFSKQPILNSKEHKFDQSFLLCKQCSHGQLGHILSPALIYNDTYTHRSGASPISLKGNDSFYSYIKKKIGDKKYKSILEIGCNDLYLLKKLSRHADETLGIDPIWKDKDHNLTEHVRVQGKFIHELKRSQDFTQPPDLVYSSHTFEHIDEIFNSLKQLFEITADECEFFIEVPSLDTLIKTYRFDQIFHQHINYFSEKSILTMVQQLGGTYVDHGYNYNYWGGTLYFMFKKTKQKVSALNAEKFQSSTSEKVLNHFEFFKNHMQQIPQAIKDLNEVAYGFGGAQMLPTLAYYMKSDLGFLKYILDDNPDRSDCYLPEIKPVIKPAQFVFDLNEATVLITALDSARPITKRLLEIQPRRIINPSLIT